MSIGEGVAVFGLGFIFGGLLGWLIGAWPQVPRPRTMTRISKGDTVCRECGTQMVESFPHAVGARRRWHCPACDRFDSYIDDERVKAYQARTGERPT